MSSLRHSHKTPKSGRQSIFLQDLATPISSGIPAITGSKSKFSTPPQASSISALWKESFGGNDLPPPPVFTLEDRSDFTPESGLSDFPKSPRYRSSSSHSPVMERSGSRKEHATPISSSGKAWDGESPAAALTSSWWLTPAGGGVEQEEKEREKGSPVEGVVQSPKLLMLPPPREVARPEMVAKRNFALPTGRLDEEEWVTVYGFSYGDTNLVLREFEKCGVILKHISGPREANWMHILYQSRSDALKALGKNGTQMNGVLIIGVKPMDPAQQQVLKDKVNENGNMGFMTLLPSMADRVSVPSSLRPSHPSKLLSSESSTAGQSGAVIASPAKSVVSKLFDAMFGI